jgi:hypothetical protein
MTKEQPTLIKLVAQREDPHHSFASFKNPHKKSPAALLDHVVLHRYSNPTTSKLHSVHYFIIISVIILLLSRTARDKKLSTMSLHKELDNYFSHLHLSDVQLVSDDATVPTQIQMQSALHLAASKSMDSTNVSLHRRSYPRALSSKDASLDIRRRKEESRWNASSPRRGREQDSSSSPSSCCTASRSRPKPPLRKTSFSSDDLIQLVKTQESETLLHSPLLLGRSLSHNSSTSTLSFPGRYTTLGVYL